MHFLNANEVLTTDCRNKQYRWLILWELESCHSTNIPSRRCSI